MPPGAITAALRAEIRNLHPRDVLVVGLAPDVLAAKLPGIHVTGAPSTLPATKVPPPLSHVAVLTAAGDSAVALAMTATAQVAGAAVVPVHGGDPRADPAAIAALAAAKPVRVVAAGAGFGPPSTLAYRVAVAATGVQLPGGGQLVFPGHRLVALYGNPESPALGALGQQDLPATIARARQMAAPYRALSSVPVVPAFEIIATVALGSPGPQGTYSAVSSLASLRPWVQQATAAGFYVILDLQPGRANLLDQAKMYEPLLAMPNVGLALDAEWKLQPGQLPLQQIGSVSIGEVNSVVSWLAGLTAELHLPQKVLVLHQFRLSMIQHEQELDTVQRRPGHRRAHGRPGYPGREAGDLERDHRGRPARGVLRLEELLRQGSPDAEPAGHDDEGPGAGDDLLPVGRGPGAPGSAGQRPPRRAEVPGPQPSATLRRQPITIRAARPGPAPCRRPVTMIGPAASFAVKPLKASLAGHGKGAWR